MRTLLQIVCVLAIALGMGLIVGGNVVLGSDSPEDVAQQMRAITMSDREARQQRGFAAGLFGFGAGFLTLGTLGLVVPWGNALIYNRRLGGKTGVGGALGDKPTGAHESR